MNALHNHNAAPTLLIVDDEPAILKSLTRVFNNSPYQLFTAECAEQADTILAEHDVHVVLSDYRMPGCSGGELLKHIQQHYPNVVSMLLSSYTDFHSVQEAINSGSAFRFLCKPWQNEELRHHVDSAMLEYERKYSALATYQASTNSKQSMHFRFAAMHRQQKIRNGIQAAINNNDFELYFQPKISLPLLAIESAEILLRWKHQELGWIPPNEFIAISELDGQIDAIWHWLSRAGIKAIKSIIDEHPHLKCISLNVSAKQFQSQNLVHDLRILLNEILIPAHFIELEITESQLAHNLSKVADSIVELKKLGFKISIDDFGTGYSSLEYVATLPIDVLKLDKSLIDDIQHCESKYLLVKHILTMAHEMNIETVVEGVEDIEQLAILKNLHCDSIQGFLFSPAVNLTAFNQLCIKQPFTMRQLR